MTTHAIFIDVETTGPSVSAHNLVVFASCALKLNDDDGMFHADTEHSFIAHVKRGVRNELALNESDVHPMTAQRWFVSQHDAWLRSREHLVDERTVATDWLSWIAATCGAARPLAVGWPAARTSLWVDRVLRHSPAEEAAAPQFAGSSTPFQGYMRCMSSWVQGMRALTNEPVLRMGARPKSQYMGDILPLRAVKVAHVLSLLHRGASCP